MGFQSNKRLKKALLSEEVFTLFFLPKLFLHHMKTPNYLAVVLAGLLLFTACQKEYSIEAGTPNGTAKGSLKNPAGDCSDITITGQYVKDSTLGDSSYVTMEVNFSTPGAYNIYTDTANGFSFHSIGYIDSTGLQSIKLKATGKPLVSQLTNFTVNLDTSHCMFTISVTDTAVIRKDAVFTLAFTGGTCANANVQGTYEAGTKLDAANLVSLDVDVTSAGSYTITAGPVNGMTFSAKSTFTSTGPQTVTLKGSGTPMTAEIDSFPVNAGGTACGFEVSVEAGTGETGGGTIADNDNAWSFNHGKAFTEGSIDLAIVNANPLGGSGSILALTGRNLQNGDSALSILLVLPGSTITPGTFKTNQGNTTLFSLNSTNTGDPIYTSNNTTPDAVITVVIVSYDASSKIVTGTFSGNVMNEAGGGKVAITNGKFRAVVQ